MRNRAIVPKTEIRDIDFHQFRDDLKVTSGQDFPHAFVKYVYDNNPEFVDQTNAVATLLNRVDMVEVVGNNIAAQMRIKYKVLLEQYEERQRGA